MIPGITVAICGEDFIVPPLTLGQLRQLMPRVQQLAGLDATQMGEAQIQTLIEIVTAALQRNYPEMTTTRVEEILDLGNALPVLNAILGGSRLPAAEPKAADDKPAAPDGQPVASAPVSPFVPHYPWRPNPPVVGS